MSQVNRSNQVRTSQFEKKAENIIKGKWGSLTIGTRLVIWVNKVGAALGVKGAALRVSVEKAQALEKLVFKTAKKEYGGSSSSLRERVTTRYEKSVREVVRRIGKLQMLGAKVSGKLSWELSNREMVSDTPERGAIGKVGEASFFHTSKGEHEEGRNEDAYAVSGSAFSVADGTSSGEKMSGQVARLFAETSTQALDELVQSGAINKMSKEDVKGYLESKLVEAGKAYNAGIKEQLDEGEQLQEWIERHGGKVGSTTGISVAKVSSSKDKVRLIGMAIGDASGTRINLNTGGVHTLYEVSKRGGREDSGGEFTTLTKPNKYSRFDDAPGYASDARPTMVDVEVDKGEIVVLASDALYDNLPGKSTEEKNEALLAIMQNPKFDTPETKTTEGPLPSVKALQDGVEKGVVSEEKALARIRNYLDAAMPPIALESWNSERAFACLPGNSYEEKVAARKAIVNNPKYDETQNVLNEVPTLSDVTASAPSSPASDEQRFQRFDNYLASLQGSSSLFKRRQAEKGIAIPTAGKPDDATVLVFKA